MSIGLVTDVLENEGDFGQTDFGSKQVVMIVSQLFICEVVPSTSTISHVQPGLI